MWIFRVAICLLLGCGVSRAENEKIVEERASTTLLLIRPKDKRFEGYLRTLEQEGERQIDRKAVDEEIQAWFDRQRADNSEFYQRRKGEWAALIVKTQQACCADLEAADARWRAMVVDAVKEFRASEEAFYRGAPTVTMRAVYRYREGQRDPSDLPEFWVVDKALEYANTPMLQTAKTFDSGDVLIRVEGEQDPILKVRQERSVSLRAWIETERDASVVFYAPDRSRPNAVVSGDLTFLGAQSCEGKLSLYRRDGKTFRQVYGPVSVGVSIGDSALNVGMKLGSEFRLEAGSLRGRIQAGKDLSAAEASAGLQSK